MNEFQIIQNLIASIIQNNQGFLAEQIIFAVHNVEEEITYHLEPKYMFVARYDNQYILSHVVESLQGAYQNNTLLQQINTANIHTQRILTLTFTI